MPNEESSKLPSTQTDEVLDAIAPPSYNARGTHHTTDDKTRVFGDESEYPGVSSSSSTSFYAPPSALARGSTLDPGPFQQHSDGPSQFSRVPSKGLSYSPFQPMFLLCNGKTLDKGFLRAPPPSSIQPHPFISHDITEDDWLSFLETLHSAANLTGKDVSRSYLPIVSNIPIIGCLSAAGVQLIMKHRKVHKVTKLIDTWNHHFFEPRKLRVVLMKGDAKLSGLTEPPVGIQGPAPAIMFAAVASEKEKYPEPSASKKSDETYRLFVTSL